jgi:PAS domain S-box-containing protein
MLITWMNVAVAFNTALAFLALSIGIFCARPHTWLMRVFVDKGVGGKIANRLAPVVLGVSLLIGWLHFTVVQSGLMNLEKAATMAVTANLFVIFLVMWLTARSANITDERRRSAERALRKAHDELEQRVRERTAELAKANAELQEQATLLDLAHDAIFVRDLDSRIIYWNKGAERTYGWKAGEAMGKIAHELLETRFSKPLEEIISLVVEKGEWQDELTHTTRWNTPIVVESRWALQRDSNGNPAGFLEINRDVTSRKMAESSMRRYAEKLEKSNQMLQDFAFVASHDLQEPLRKIHSFGDRLQRLYADSLGETGRDYLERMLGAADRMSLLLQSLLAYSRVTTQTKPPVQVDLAKLVTEVVLDLEVPIHETRAQVEVGELPSIQADPGQMRQLFQNLIGNALKYHKDGEPPHVRVYSNSCWNGSCEIFVEDNGIGFEEKHVEKIFAPFQRLHGRSSSYKGSGMGLAICRKITERHNGTISARSSPGKGSTFTVSLPLLQCDEKELWGQEACPPKP